MEIHAPHHPIMSVREFLVHLAMVTLGILIALGLEQSVEVYHHRELAQEARANMLTELSENKKELESHLSGLPKLQKDRENDLAVVNQLLARKPLQELSMGLSFSGSTLSSASWTTASTVGALAYMEYDEVKRFAEAYKLQEFFDNLQHEEVRDVQRGVGLLGSLKEGPEKIPPEELRALKAQLQQSSAALTVLDQLGRQLDTEYDKVLSRKNEK